MMELTMYQIEMDSLSEAEIKEINDQHILWIAGKGGERANFSGKTLWNLDLRDYPFVEADFSKCLIYDCIMPHNLLNSSFKQAELISVNFQRCDLTHAAFDQARCGLVNFQGAKLGGATLNQTELKDCNFTKTNLRYCQLRVYTAGPWTAYIRPDFTSIGCQHHSNEDWKRFTNYQIDDMSSQALKYWEENKKLIFMMMDSFKKDECDSL